MKIKPRGHTVLVELIKDVEYETPSGIVTTVQTRGRFVTLKVLAIGEAVENLKEGDEVYANPLQEIISPANKNICFINDKDIIAVIEK